jgi:basic membrane protein A
MRGSRWLILALAVAVAALVVSLAACGGDDDEAAPTEPATTEASETEEATPASDYKVALITTGALNNRSWANAWADGAKRAEQELGVEVRMVGNADAPDQYVSQGSAFASQGYDLLIFAHGAMHDSGVRVAKQFPDVEIVQVYQHASEEEQQQDPPNLGHVDPEQAHGTFLAGALAGLMTKTNTIGTVFAFPFPALTRQPEAFELGARCVNPDVKALQRQSNSFTDAALARAAASALISRGADFVLSAVDQAVQGVIQAAAQAQGRGQKAYAIASYFDSNELNPDAVITSVLYNLEGVAYDIIKRGVEGDLGEHFFESYTFGSLEVGDLAPLYEQEELVGQQNVDRLEKIKQMVADGTIRIPDETVGDADLVDGATIGKPGSAKKIDVADLGCTDEFRAELGL